MLAFYLATPRIQNLNKIYKQIERGYFFAPDVTTGILEIILNKIKKDSPLNIQAEYTKRFIYK